MVNSFKDDTLPMTTIIGMFVFLILCIVLIYFTTIYNQELKIPCLIAGSTLNGKLTSPNNKYEAYVSNDGNFSIYNKKDNSKVWSIEKQPGSGKLVMQKDGNVVLSTLDTNEEYWSSNTKDSSNNMLCLTNEGKLTIGNGRKVNWSS